MRQVAVRLGIVLAVGLLASACSEQAPTGPSSVNAPASPSVTGQGTSTTSASAPQASEPRAGFEINYLKFVADHHLMGVMMAEMCVAKAVHDELRQDCQMNVETQTREMEMILSWLRQFYGIEYEPEVSGEGMMKQLEGLSGEEFEMEFLEDFPRHHKTVIQRSEVAARNAVHEEVRQLAQNIVTAQTADAIRLVTWKCEWYGDCNPVAGFFPAT